jgi:predicted HicB family RNase H-like nuclease
MTSAFRDKITALVEQGVPYHDVAVQVGSTYDSVKTIVSQARAAGKLPRYAKKYTVKIDERLMLRLASEARKRNCSTNELCRRIIEAVCDDELFIAVLQED